MRKTAVFLILMLAASCGGEMAGGPQMAAGRTESAPATMDAAPPRKPAARQSGGFLAALFGGPAASDSAPGDAEEADTPVPVVLAAPGSAAAAAPEAPESEIAHGTVLPYGEVARICGLTPRQMGKQIAQYPERRPKHRLYDGDPGNTALHSFYLTGFADGCARQFTAALAMFGSVEMHEQLRYGLPAEVQPYSDTDKAYERLKRKVCGKPKRKPCGSQIGKLARDTVFLSLYERFDGSARWSNLLLHRGELVAQDRKSGV